ncbi:MAG: hypothetical protein IMZ46_03075 [Acidobacteria bacterium]|nr:hypothetical protein [Acidobacteriota bacterium]
MKSPLKRKRNTQPVEKEPSRDTTPDPEEDDAESEEESDEEPAKATPTRRRGRAAKPDPPPADTIQQTPSRKRRASIPDPAPADAILETPTKRTKGSAKDAVTPSRAQDAVTPRRRNAADKSAKKKSMRALIHNIVNDQGSDEEEQTDLARAIYDSDNAEEEEDEDDEPDPNATPSKTPRRRGRPRKHRSPTPPRDLPPHELYFHFYKPGKVATSDKTLSGVDLLTHDEYFSFWRAHEDPHAEPLGFLSGLHADSFPQWEFELTQGFSVCLYGMGSKRDLLRRFAARAHENRSPRGDDKIVVVNGYVRSITARDILTAVSAALDPKKPASAQPSLLIESISSSLKPPTTLTLLINSIDAPPLRRPATQAILSQLASHPRIRLLCSADTPDFPLLWDISLRSAFNFLFHDATTLAPLSAELSVVDDVHELLGRAARRAGGLEAVSVVLGSLTANARQLYGLLIAEVLTAMGEGGGGDGENPGVEFRMLFNKAVEAFVCPSSEMAFRQLLRE